MQELQNAISKLTFASFCNKITQKENGAIEFELKHRFHKNQKPEVYCIQEIDDNIIISDTGCTYDNLDDVFVLSEPDVIKNIVTVLRCYDMVKLGKSFVCRLEPSKEILPQIIRFICGTQYLYAMKVFYV